MIKTKLKVLVDIYAVISLGVGIIPDANLNNRFDYMINQIIGLSNSAYSISKIEVGESVDEIVDKEHEPSLFSRNTIIKFSYLYEYDSEEFSDNEDPDLAKSIFNYQEECSAINFIFSKVSNIITCSNIIMPGVVGVKKFHIYKDNKYLRSLDFYVHSNSVQMNNPIFTDNMYLNVDLLKSLVWFNKIEIKDDCSTTPLGRAIGALNNLLFSSLDKSNSTMWTLVAIESLFCREGDVSKIQQIVRKSELIVPHIVNSSDLKKMYDARSRFFHGDTNFHLYPKLPTFSTSGEVGEQHLQTALNLLFGTLQFMLYQDKHELIFKRGYVLE